MEFNEKIKQLRLSQDMTLEDVARVVGVGKSTVRKWETGDIANMRRDKIAKLAEALHTSPAYLMGWADNLLSVASSTKRKIMYYLSEARESAGKTQADAAHHLGVDADKISDWERGYAYPGSDDLLKLLIFYHADIYDFFECADVSEMPRVNSDYLSGDALEVAEAYSALETVEAKDMVRRSLDLPPLETRAAKIG